MLPDLPDETWIHIIEIRPIEYFPNSRRFLHSLTLTCKRLRLIATPFIYRRLRFAVDFDEDEDRPFELTMTGLIRDLTRAKSLLRSPHLLRHVQRLALRNWDDHVSRTVIAACYFCPEANWDINLVNTQDAGNMISVIYDLIMRLILHMPGLQQLDMMESPMTPLLYTAICSLPRLTSFEYSVYGSTVIHEQSGAIDSPPTLHIRKLRYYNSWTNGYLSHILAWSITSLHTLSITSPNLPLVPSYICNRVLPLKTLQVEFHLYKDSADYDAFIALWDTLRATPYLRTLLINGNGSDVPPPDDLCNHLHNLYQLSASPMIIRKLAQGMELDAIEIRGPFHISELSVARSVPCSLTHLREVYLRAVHPMTQQELDKFISSFHVFQNLEYLDINHEFPETPATDVDFHESWKVIKNLWQKLRHLHRFNLHGYNLFEYPNQEPYGIEVACPLDINDELLPRGHPTLERIGVSFMRRTLWEWDPEHGWLSGRWSYEAWHDKSYMSWNRI